MGSGFSPGGPARGVIPEVMEELFARIEAGKEGSEFSVRVSFVEIHKVRRSEAPTTAMLGLEARRTEWQDAGWNCKPHVSGSGPCPPNTHAGSQ
jgi:hypothetical protein